MKKKFIWETITVSESQTITSNCADIYFFNVGSDTVLVNGVPLQTNDAMSDPAFGDEVNVTQYQCVFTTTVNPILFVKRKKYS